MKRASVFCLAIVAAAVLPLVACGSETSRLSERRSVYLEASDGFATVAVVSGVRETPYEADGRACPLKPYTLVTVVPVTFDVDAVITYTVEFGGGLYGGTLAVHPFAASFSAEVDAEAGSDVTVTLGCGGQKHTYKPESLVAPGSIPYDRAIEAADRALSPSGGYETRARLIKNPIGGEGLCWYVEFCFEQGRSGVLLDPLTAKVLAKKTG